MRLLNRPLALLLALALAAVSVTVIIEVIAVAVHAHPVVVHWGGWYRWAQRTRWKQGVIRFWSVVLIVAGAALLLVEVKPRPVTRLRMASEDDATDAGMTRRGLAGAVRAAALDVDGIRRAAVTVTRRTVRVSATAAAKDPAGAGALKDPVAQAIAERLDNLQLTHRPRVRIRVAARSK